jgi:hypothetical protein
VLSGFELVALKLPLIYCHVYSWLSVIAAKPKILSLDTYITCSKYLKEMSVPRKNLSPRQGLCSLQKPNLVAS